MQQGHSFVVLAVLLGAALIAFSTLLLVTQTSSSAPRDANVFSARWLRTLPVHRRLDGTDNSPFRYGLSDARLTRLIPMRAAVQSASASPSLQDVSDIFASCADDTVDPRLSAYAWLWGQFIDHTLTDTNGTDVDAVNHETAFLDGSIVYSHDAATLRTLRDDADSARMRTNGTLLAGWPRFEAGDRRRDVHALLLAMHTAWVREHNWWVHRLFVDDGVTDNDALFETARALVIGEIQAITYREWLPLIIGRRRAAEYAPRRYNVSVQPQIFTEFATACYRYGHSMVGQRAGGIDLVDSFVHGTDYVRRVGIEPLLAAAASEHSERVDACIVDAMRTTQNFTMPTLNVMRGRQRRLAPYAAFRERWDVPRAASWRDVTSNDAMVQRLVRVYGRDPSAPHVDAYVGMLAEDVDTEDDAAVGVTLAECIGDQLQRVAEGDAYYFEWSPHDAIVERYRDEVRATTLGAVLARTTNVAMRENVFLMNG